MGSPISFTGEDLLRDKIVEPGWYTVKVTDYSEEISSKGDSTNYKMEGVIVRNAQNGSEEFSGVPVRWNFNSKAISFAIGFLRAFGIDVSEGKRYDLGAVVGELVDIHIKTGTYQDRPKNEINHAYRPATPVS